jgi:acyl transferase domain-containing protein/NAD(P)-dependent dehydrogenase (short-subunit alcohol dehydrogenase family)/acyl carrier protein
VTTVNGTSSTSRPTEPLAIVGIGCRFPGGADSPESLWNLIVDGRDGVVDIPADRWDADRFYDSDPTKPGKMYVRRAAFLEESIEEFDALFFGISPREAELLDPQQRLLLETAWEALENAGIGADDLAGTDTGVYVGAFTVDNQMTQMSIENRDKIATHSAVSSTFTMLSNRLSYVLDLRGPSLTMDTACSSSLVAFHQACQAIWRGECSAALVGGVNVMFRPEGFIAMCKGQFLSPDGRSKSFDSRANGYGRGEAAGVVVVKPLAQAQADGDRIYSVVRATGANQDGRTVGITVPNGDAQKQLFEEVCAEAEIDPTQVALLEAHGTGTPVGDPIEARSLGSVYGVGRSDGQTCALGSIKANIGHTEAAAGVAGVIKASLALHNGVIPPLANLEEPNPEIPFDELGLRLPREAEPIPETGHPALAAVNSFGYGGTNAHVILEQPPASQAPAVILDAEPGTERMFALSARSPEALDDLVGAYIESLAGLGERYTFDEICDAATTRRSHLSNRLLTRATGVGDLAAKLATYRQEGFADGVTTGKVEGSGSRSPVFVYTGMGPQWWGMGRELLATEPVFRHAVERCDQAYRAIAGFSIIEELSRDEADSQITKTELAQPANFTIQYGLTALWRSWGIEPAAIVGHSVGETTAAHISGVLSFEDAISVSYHRGRIQSQTAGMGAMLAVGLPEAEVADLVAAAGGTVSVAAVNSPNSVTLAGDEDGLASIAEWVEGDGAFNRFLTVEVPYHSHYMDDLKAELRTSLAHLDPSPPSIPLYSTVSGGPVDGSYGAGRAYDAEYWCDNVREAVRFADAMAAIIDDEHTLFLEVGPHPVLGTSILECATEAGVRVRSAASLRRRDPEQATMARALGELYCAGMKVDWAANRVGSGRFVPLPGYRWQREQYWHESGFTLADRRGNDGHPLLDLRITDPQPTWETRLSPTVLPFIPDHEVDGVVVFPGAGYIETALAAHRDLTGADATVLTDIEFHRALVIDDGEEPVLRLTFDETSRDFRVDSRGIDRDSNWTLRATGVISAVAPGAPDELDPAAVRARASTSIDVETTYDVLERRGLRYAEHFRRIASIQRGTNDRGESEILARIEPHPEPGKGRGQWRLHPTMLDACFQSMIALLDDDGSNRVFVPVGIGSLILRQAPADGFWVVGSLTDLTVDSMAGHLTLFDDDGAVLAEVRGFRCQALGRELSAVDRLPRTSYRWEWHQSEPNDSLERVGTWVILADNEATGRQLADVLGDEVGPGVLEPVVVAGRPSPDELTAVLDDVEHLSGIAYLGGLDQGPAADADQLPAIDQLDNLAGLLRTLDATGIETRLHVVTRNAVRVGDDDQLDGLDQSPLIGLTRVAVNEYPQLNCSMVDIDDTPESLTELAAELLADSPEDSVAFRTGVRHVLRLDRMPVRQLDEALTSAEPSTVAADEPFELEQLTVGSLDSLALRLTDRPAPGPGEVEIKISATALNFKDVAKGMNIMADEALEGTFHGRGLGLEAAGTVARVGDGVTNIAVGQRVVMSVPGCFRRYAILPAESDQYRPTFDDVDMAHSAGVPTVFVTAYHGLVGVADLQPGERVLIHAGAGGVGLAAVQVAQWIGAEIFATAGSESKREYLRSLGVEHVMDSRSLDFADEIKSITDGEGVDVVLNSLPGEYIAKSLDVLAPFGRFVEIGKRDLVEGTEISLEPFNRTISFTTIDFDRMFAMRPEKAGELIGKIWERFAAGDFTPVSTHVFPASELVEAFKFMARSQHTGKVVVSWDEEPTIEALPPRDEGSVFSPDGSYLITGGCGGFGLAIAQWLVANGVRHLILVGRSGAASDEAKQAIEAMVEAGAQVEVVAADVTDRAGVAEIMAVVDRGPVPLKGVLHAAAVLDDDAIDELDRSRFERVMGPKIIGARLLDEATADRHLDLFILFSSVAALIGNGRQGNYVAANAWLDAFAEHRRARGLPATSVNWGPIAEVGMAAANAQLETYLSLSGFTATTVDGGMEAVEHALRWEPSQIGLFDLDWLAWSQFEPTSGASPRFAELVETGEGGDMADHPFHQELSALPGESRLDVLTYVLAEQIAETLRMPADKLDVNGDIQDLGMDSLMAVELQTMIRLNIGVEISALEMTKGETIAEMGSILLGKMNLADGPAVESAGDAPGNPVGAPAGGSAGAGGSPGGGGAGSAGDSGRTDHDEIDLDAMSDDEVDALLSALTD